jgi:hypothetical protein
MLTHQLAHNQAPGSPARGRADRPQPHASRRCRHALADRADRRVFERLSRRLHSYRHGPPKAAWRAWSAYLYGARCTKNARYAAMRYVGMTTTEYLPEVRLRGARVPAFSARHPVADARGTDAPAHLPLVLIAERGGQVRDSRARSRRSGRVMSMNYPGSRPWITDFRLP